MAGPARQRILDAAADLARTRGIGRLTTREIAVAAQASEGSLFKNFTDKAGLLTELLSYELPENRAWRAVAAEPPGHTDLADALVPFIERAIDFYAAALSVVAGSLADRELLSRHRDRNRERGTGPQLAIQVTAGYLRGWQDCGQLDPAADPAGMAIALCGGALLYAWTEELAGAEQVPGGRDGFIRALITAAVGPYLTEGHAT
jgi:AcrR family transcriptional regulator